jgi:hypothetical protein
MALMLAALPACGAPLPPATSPPTQVFTDPAGLFTIDAPGQPEPSRPAQELTHVGAVSFQVHRFNPGPYAMRAYAFAYPWCGSPDPRGCGPVIKFDAAGDLWHSSGKQIARMRGRPESFVPVTVPGADGLVGRDTLFALAGGRGVMRTLIAPPPRPRRWVAFCLAPDTADFGPCLAFVRSLRPATGATPPAAAR